ncbi:MAG: hypothetical protein R3C43_19960, partial [Chloroflexota bacterium]
WRLIGSDPVRMATNSFGVQNRGADNFFGYPETKGNPPAYNCGPQHQDSLRQIEHTALNGDVTRYEREEGYLAPPLFGVWATTPYLHNGSVPNLRAVLDSSLRPRLWQRQSTPPPAGLPDPAAQVIMGFDTNFDRAYDRGNLGWKYQEINCIDPSDANTIAVPYVSCSPDGDADPAVQQILAKFYGNVSSAWNISGQPFLTKQQVEQRKIYNTHLFSQGNSGHEFSDVLTAQEVDAVLEYLKTL